MVATHTELQRLKTALYKSKPSSFIPDRTIDPSTVQRGAERNNAIDDPPQRVGKGPSSTRPALELFQRQPLGKRLRDGVKRIWAFPGACELTQSRVSAR